MRRSWGWNWRRRCTSYIAADFKIERMAELLVNQSAFDALVAGQDPRRIAQEWQEGLEKFGKVREKYLIYK